MIWVIFYIFSAIVIAGGSLMIWRGFPSLSRGGTGVFRKITSGALVFAGLLLVIAGLTIIDRSGSYPERIEVANCRKRLEEIHARIESYRESNDGRMPESLREMVEKGFLIERDLVCPAYERLEEGNDKNGPSDFTFYYRYRKADDPDSSEIIAWDEVPHMVPHKVFKFLEKPRVNALYSDGEVRLISLEVLGPEAEGD